MNTIKKTIPIFCVLCFLSFVVKSAKEITATTNNVLSSKANNQEISVFKDKLKPIFSAPKKLLMESANINVKVAPVGIEDDGSLDTPKDWSSAGWYKDGAMPGQNGNLIINAHYDDNFGKPAAFWQLKNIKVGDKVIVVDSFGRRFTYGVTQYQFIGISDPDRFKVFENSKSAKITLITCGGVFLPGKATYDKRLAVTGELIR